jgi:hypothetical protein
LSTSLELCSQSGTALILEHAPPPALRGWLRVTLIRDGEQRFLGADSASIVIPRLVKALRDGAGTERSAGTVEGLAVASVLSLAEAHATLYAHGEPTGRLRLLVQDSSARWLASLDLDQDERNEWDRRLSSYLTAIYGKGS